MCRALADAFHDNPGRVISLGIAEIYYSKL